MPRQISRDMPDNGDGNENWCLNTVNTSPIKTGLCYDLSIYVHRHYCCYCYRNLSLHFFTWYLCTTGNARTWYVFNK